MAPSSLTVNYYAGGPGGTLVLSESGVSPGASAWGPGAFDASVILSYPDHGPIRPDGGTDAAGAVQGYPDTFGGGSALTADSFDIIPVGSANTFGGYSADNITAGGISSFTITGVSIIPEPATFSLVALGGLALLWRLRKAKV